MVLDLGVGVTRSADHPLSPPRQVKWPEDLGADLPADCKALVEGTALCRVVFLGCDSLPCFRPPSKAAHASSEASSPRSPYPHFSGLLIKHPNKRLGGARCGPHPGVITQSTSVKRLSPPPTARSTKTKTARCCAAIHFSKVDPPSPAHTHMHTHIRPTADALVSL